MRPIPKHCEFRGGRGIRRHGAVEECQQPARYVCPDGELRTLLLWHPHSSRYVGPCHWDRVKTLAEQARANWPDFPKDYALYEQTEAEERQERFLAARFRHALSDTLPYHSGGLMRQDNSHAGDVDLTPVPANLRRVG